MPNFPLSELVLADRRLEQRIVSYFVNHGRPELCKLRIRAHDGVVRLRGRLSSAADRLYAIESCRRVAGVLRIEDEIAIGAAPNAPWAATSNGLGRDGQNHSAPPVLLSA